jgi:hypothetical protein
MFGPFIFCQDRARVVHGSFNYFVISIPFNSRDIMRVVIPEILRSPKLLLRILISFNDSRKSFNQFSTMIFNKLIFVLPSLIFAYIEDLTEFICSPESTTKMGIKIYNESTMKVKHAIILIAIGFCFEFFGSWMRIMHWRNGNEVLLAAVVLKIAGTVLLLFKLMTNSKLRAWLNS